MTDSTLLHRTMILRVLEEFPYKGVEFNLRVTAPPTVGWWVEVNENNLQMFSDYEREGILIYLNTVITQLREQFGVPVGIVRSGMPGDAV